MNLYVSYVKINRAYENVFCSVVTDLFGNKESGAKLTAEDLNELVAHIRDLEPSARGITIINWEELA